MVVIGLQFDSKGGSSRRTGGPSRRSLWTGPEAAPKSHEDVTGREGERGRFAGARRGWPALGRGPGRGRRRVEGLVEVARGGRTIDVRWSVASRPRPGHRSDEGREADPAPARPCAGRVDFRRLLPASSRRNSLAERRRQSGRDLRSRSSGPIATSSASTARRSPHRWPRRARRGPRPRHDPSRGGDAGSAGPSCRRMTRAETNLGNR